MLLYASSRAAGDGPAEPQAPLSLQTLPSDIPLPHSRTPAGCPAVEKRCFHGLPALTVWLLVPREASLPSWKPSGRSRATPHGQAARAAEHVGGRRGSRSRGTAANAVLAGLSPRHSPIEAPSLALLPRWRCLVGVRGGCSLEEAGPGPGWAEPPGRPRAPPVTHALRGTSWTPRNV